MISRPALREMAFSVDQERDVVHDHAEPVLAKRHNFIKAREYRCVADFSVPAHVKCYCSRRKQQFVAIRVSSWKHLFTLIHTLKNYLSSLCSYHNKLTIHSILLLPYSQYHIHNCITIRKCYSGTISI